MRHHTTRVAAFKFVLVFLKFCKQQKVDLNYYLLETKIRLQLMAELKSFCWNQEDLKQISRSETLRQ